LRWTPVSSSTPPPQLPPAGWYSDPERSGLRWWDGARWTDHRQELVSAQPAQALPLSGDASTDLLTRGGGQAVPLALVLALVGAGLAIVGVLLPAAEVKSAVHIAKNSLIQHPEGPVVVAVALLGVLATLRGGAALPLLAGLALVGLAVYAGTHASSLVALTAVGTELLQQTAGTVLGERISEAVDASPGPRVWTIGVGGAFLMPAGARRAESSTELLWLRDRLGV